MGLTTHALDTAQGKPATGVRFRLRGGGGHERKLVDSYTTNADGRTDTPLLQGEDGIGGTWELVYLVGEYFAGQAVVQDDPPFLDEVTIRFTMGEDERHYQAPLLVSPWAHSTYRGS